MPKRPSLRDGARARMTNLAFVVPKRLSRNDERRGALCESRLAAVNRRLWVQGSVIWFCGGALDPRLITKPAIAAARFVDSSTAGWLHRRRSPYFASLA